MGARAQEAEARAERVDPLAIPHLGALDLGTGVALVGALLVGLALRWLVMRGPLGYVDLDEATAGIAAQRFWEEPRLLFPNQPYGGTFEVWLVALAFRVSANAFVLKCVPIALHAAAAAIAWRAAVRIVPSVAGQLAVPILLWVGPAFAIWESTKARGFYGATIVLSSLAILLVLRVVDDPTPVQVAAFGVAAGVALWTSPLLVLVYGPCAAWMFDRRPGLWRQVPWLLAGAAAGALPWLGWNAWHGWSSLSRPDDGGGSTIDLLTDGLGKVPALVGMATPWDQARTVVPAAGVLTAVALAAIVAIATARTRAAAPGLLATGVVGYLLIYALVVPIGATGQDLRYLYPLLPLLALAIGAVVPDPAAARDRALLLGAIAGAAALVSWWGLAGMEQARSSDRLFLAAPGIGDVVAFLEEREVDHVTTDLAGTQITFASGGDIEAASFAAPRFGDLQRAMTVEEPSVYVLETGRHDNDRQLERVAEAEGIGFEKHRFGVWTVYVLDAWLPPWRAGLTAFGGRITRAGSLHAD